MCYQMLAWRIMLFSRLGLIKISSSRCRQKKPMTLVADGERDMAMVDPVEMMEMELMLVSSSLCWLDTVFLGGERDTET